MANTKWLAPMCLFALVGARAADAMPTFFTDEAAFLSSSTTTLTDFESLTGTPTQQSFTINGNTFRDPLTTVNNAMAACGTCAGAPFDSIVMVVNFGNVLRIDLGPGTTAAGGIFGDLNGPAGPGTIRLFDSSGLIDTQSVNVGDMGAGEPNTFFGWTLSTGSMTGIEFELANAAFEAVDDFRAGVSGTFTNVPVVPTLPFLAFGAALLFGVSRKTGVLRS